MANDPESEGRFKEQLRAMGVAAGYGDPDAARLRWKSWVRGFRSHFRAAFDALGPNETLERVVIGQCDCSAPWVFARAAVVATQQRLFMIRTERSALVPIALNITAIPWSDVDHVGGAVGRLGGYVCIDLKSQRFWPNGNQLKLGKASHKAVGEFVTYACARIWIPDISSPPPAPPARAAPSAPDERPKPGPAARTRRANGPGGR